MKKQLKNIIGKLLIVTTLAVILTGAIFAQKAEKRQVLETSQKTVELIRQRLKEKVKTEGSTVKQANTANGSLVSAASQTNFNLGSNFIIAMTNASYIDNDSGAADSTIVRLVYMIDQMEGQPEADALQNTLKSLVRGTSNAAKVRLEIENAMKSYTGKLTGDQKWFYDAGQSVTNLIFHIYSNDQALVKKNLSEIQNLIKLAPHGTPEEIIAPMQTLAKYVSQTTFAENDYTAIIEGAVGIFDSVNA